MASEIQKVPPSNVPLTMDMEGKAPCPLSLDFLMRFPSLQRTASAEHPGQWYPATPSDSISHCVMKGFFSGSPEGNNDGVSENLTQDEPSAAYLFLNLWPFNLFFYTLSK